MSKPIAYAKHPLAQDDKKKLIADGFKVVDLKHKPDVIGKEDTIFPKPRKPRAKKKEE